MYKKEIPNSVDLARSISPEDLTLIKKNIDLLRSKYNTDIEGLFDLIKNSIKTSVPANIFIENLSPFETIVKYLHENKNISLNKIADLTARTKQNIYTTYNKANKKHSKKLKESESEHSIPAEILGKTKSSVLECISKYLHEELELSFHEISNLLKRKYGTIWTVYNRALKKEKGKSR